MTLVQSEAAETGAVRFENPKRAEWQARSLVVLGDSTAVGLGDPLPGGRWRGVGPLLAEALSDTVAVRLTNLSLAGARMADVRRTQLPEGLLAQPDVVVIIVGMNDTLRADFDPVGMHEDLDHVVSTFKQAGAVVLTVTFHDHSKVFRLPGALSRALRSRIEQLNSVITTVATRRGAGCLDISGLDGTYDMAAWSVDRLHPSELGHRMLALGFSELLTGFGCRIPNPVSLVCSGGAKVGLLGHIAWLILKGIPFLWRRSRDLMPHAIMIVMRSALDNTRRLEAARADLGPVRQIESRPDAA